MRDWEPEGVKVEVNPAVAVAVAAREREAVWDSVQVAEVLAEPV